MSRGAWGTVRRRLLGLGFIVLVAALVSLSIAMYNKAFTPVVKVSLSTDKIGNQLQVLGDVKARGLIVGEIRAITPTAEGAVLELALDPEKADLLPRNVSARFIPKTLFGDRYVALQIPEDPDSRSLGEGDRIEQDRSAPAVELSQALDHLLPVLQAVQPQKLSTTLTAISTALDGRGEQLGQTLVELGQLVEEINPHVPQLTHDLRALVEVSDTYTEAIPDFVSALDDLTVTSRTVYEQRANLDALFADLTMSSRDLESFLRANSDNLIRLADSSRDTLELLAKYSPSYPCFLKQMAALVDAAKPVFGGGTDAPGLHATIEVVVNKGKYEPGKDTPEFNEHRGPRCYDPKQMGSPFPDQPPDGPLQDGTSHGPQNRTQQDGLLPPANGEEYLTEPNALTSADSIANTPAEQEFLAQLIAPGMGVEPGQVPGWSTLLLGPMFRGAEVTVR
ncbi:MCE family protein [Actinophytocola algeriensis]|uniref:Virulence factor Mce-like protein n=1 Tax=Actinophytocola algeriensis TaxID=1768010 RepID=A0A7W7VIR5_9PSEU|nr:MCE family protein [Actinophytocola algeriensis]MBB4911325.1 virulence factor Mce-like protein [Actinophytocola algeriensis]MBE1479264.1 virulence factor Mce-like protein [Actinophytocola algeriensis]